MAGPTKVNLKIYQGSTFSQVLRWESAIKVYSPITNISKTAPITITASSHGLPQGWRFKIIGVLGMKEINTQDYLFATDVLQNSVTVNSLNSLSYTTYTGGGVLEYNQPIDLAGYTARMQIRPNTSSTTVLDELTTTNNKIVLDNTKKTITLALSSSTTAGYTFKKGVYSLEMEKSGIVTTLAYGNILVEQEVTR